MNDDNTTTSEPSPKENKDKKELPAFPAETSIEDSTVKEKKL
jgi:hypothetical protein